MSKKRKKKQSRQDYNYGYGYPPQTGFNPQSGGPFGGYGHAPDHGAQGYGAGYGYGPAGFNRDFFRDISSFLPTQHTNQFLMGLVIGAGAAWVLGDEEIRGKLIKAAMKAYAGVAGSFEEFKEQMADIRAEVAEEQHESE
jgi:hypothetical protein